MKIISAEYLISAVGPKQYPEDGFAEIAFIGRSNVGKSSLINALLNRKALARTSAKPGKTQCINFFNINKEFFFVDLPGYGYAKVSKESRATWGKMIEAYLKERDKLELIVLLVDLRHSPSQDDVYMYNWIKHFERPVVVVATKADKISRGQRAKHVKEVKEKLQLHPGDKIITFSSETKDGKEELWQYLQEYISPE